MPSQSKAGNVFPRRPYRIAYLRFLGPVLYPHGAVRHRLFAREYLRGRRHMRLFGRIGMALAFVYAVVLVVVILLGLEGTNLPSYSFMAYGVITTILLPAGIPALAVYRAVGLINGAESSGLHLQWRTMPGVGDISRLRLANSVMSPYFIALPGLAFRMTLIPLATILGMAAWYAPSGPGLSTPLEKTSITFIMMGLATIGAHMQAMASFGAALFLGGLGASVLVRRGAASLLALGEATRDDLASEDPEVEWEPNQAGRLTLRGLVGVATEMIAVLWTIGWRFSWMAFVGLLRLVAWLMVLFIALALVMGGANVIDSDDDTVTKVFALGFIGLLLLIPIKLVMRAIRRARRADAN